MTVREWIAAKSAAVPKDLSTQILQLLGADAEQPGSRTGELCLAAATRALRELLAAGGFGRETALRLLAIDALTTFAFEHACESPGGPAALSALASSGARGLSQLATNRG